MQLTQEQKYIVETEAPISELEKRELLRPIEEDLNILYVAATSAQKKHHPNFDLAMYLGR